MTESPNEMLKRLQDLQVMYSQIQNHGAVAVALAEAIRRWPLADEVEQCRKELAQCRRELDALLLVRP